MVQLSKELIKEFQKIMKKDYRAELSFKKASKVAYGLVTYFDILSRLYRRQKERKNKK